MLLAFHTERRVRLNKTQWINIVLAAIGISLAIFLSMYAYDVSTDQQFLVDTKWGVAHSDEVIPHLIMIPIVFMIIYRHNDHKFSRKWVRYSLSYGYLSIIISFALLSMFRVWIPFDFKIAILSINCMFMLAAALINLLTAKLNIYTLVGHVVAKPTMFSDKKMVWSTYIWIMISQLYLLLITLLSKYITMNFGYTLILAILSIHSASRAWRKIVSWNSFVEGKSIILRQFMLMALFILLALSLAFLSATFFTDIKEDYNLVQIIMTPILFVPSIVSFIVSQRVTKNRDVIDLRKSELSIVIRALSYSIITIFLLIVSTEMNYYIYGNTQNNIYMVICATLAIISIVLPFYWIWAKFMSSTASIFLIVLSLVMVMFLCFKWYFYVYYSSDESLLFGVLAENWYTILTLVIFILICSFLVHKRFKNNESRVSRYRDKVVK